MVRANDGRDRIGERDALQDFGAHQRVDLHLLEFFRGQAPGLVDDVFGNRQLADVVQQRSRAQRFDFGFGKSQFLRDLNREYAHALQVLVRGVVLGFDGQRKGLDGAQVQRGDLFGVAFFDFDLPLFRRQLGEIEMIRSDRPR